MSLHTQRPFTKRLLLICLLNIAVSPAHSYWINHVPGNFEWYAANTKSDTPEGAAQRRCEIQYHGTKPLDTLWYIETREGRAVYGFTCGNIYTIPSNNRVVWYSCDLPGQAYSPSGDTCLPVEEICGEGGYSYELGRCLNRNFGNSSCPTTPYIGNPINVATGNKFQIETDFAARDSTTLRFERFYNSLKHQNHNSMLGGRWRSNFDASIELQLAWGMYRVVFHRPDGATLLFELHNGKWVGPNNARISLQHATDAHGNITEWVLVHAHGEKEKYDSSGRLIALHDSQARVTTLDYDPAGRLIAVRDPAARSLAFSYDEMGRLIQLSDPAGHTYAYAYDTAGNLAEVQYPDDTPSNTTDNPRRIYRYEDGRFPTHLTSIVDERGHVYASWVYDDKGRAVSSTHAAGTGDHSVVFNADGTTTVVDPLGHENTYGFSDQFGRRVIASTTSGDCQGCTTSYTYDENGYVASRTDRNGNVTAYQRDALGRELSRTEAFGTPEARTITTTWHPQLGRPLTVTEPGRITSYTYDPEGRLLSSSMQPQP